MAGSKASKKDKATTSKSKKTATTSKGKSKASTSEARAPPPAPTPSTTEPFTRARFKELLESRKPVKGRAIENGPPFSDYIQQYNWQKFTETPPKAQLKWVGEFYAQLWFNPGQPPIVQGHTIEFSPVAINSYYGLTVLGDDGEDTLTYDVTYTPAVSQSFSTDRRFELARHMYTPEALLRTQGYLRENFGSVRRSFCTPEARAWMYFVSANLIPKEHVSEISSDRVKLAYAIMCGLGIDVGQVIYDTIIGANTLDEIQKRRSLPCPNLITGLCLRAGLEMGRPSIHFLDPAQVITLNDYLPREARRERREQLTGPEQGSHAEPSTHPHMSSPPPSTHEQESSYASIEARLDTVIANQAQIMQQLASNQAQLATLTEAVQYQQEWSSRLEASIFEDPEPFPGQPRPSPTQVYRRRLRRSSRLN